MKPRGVLLEPYTEPLDVTQIHDTIWMGSRPWPYGDGERLYARGFRWLMLCAQEYQPGADAFGPLKLLYAPMDDVLDFPSEQHHLALEAAKVVAQTSLREKILVTCWEGRNRSGLVVGLALKRLGMSGLKAKNMIRRKRERALTNQTFVDILITHP